MSDTEMDAIEDEEIELGSQDTDEEEGDEDFLDVAEVLTSLLAAEDDNVCTAMLKVGKQLETQNKILVKILTHLVNSKKES